MSSGASRKSYSKRQKQYDDLIGKIDALRIQSQARPMPRPLASQVLGLGPSPQTPPQEIEVLEAPTTGILERLSGTLNSMRDHDKQFGLTPMLVIGFKQRFAISMDQALTYEKALER